MELQPGQRHVPWLKTILPEHPVAADMDGSRFMVDYQPGRADAVVLMQGLARCRLPQPEVRPIQGAYAALTTGACLAPWRVVVKMTFCAVRFGSAVADVQPYGPGVFRVAARSPKKAARGAGGSVSAGTANIRSCRGTGSEPARMPTVECRLVDRTSDGVASLLR